MDTVRCQIDADAGKADGRCQRTWIWLEYPHIPKMPDSLRELEEFLGKGDHPHQSNQQLSEIHECIRFLHSNNWHQDAAKGGQEAWQKSSREVVDQVYQDAVKNVEIKSNEELAQSVRSSYTRIKKGIN